MALTKRSPLTPNCLKLQISKFESSHLFCPRKTAQNLGILIAFISLESLPDPHLQRGPGALTSSENPPRDQYNFGCLPGRFSHLTSQKHVTCQHQHLVSACVKVTHCSPYVCNGRGAIKRPKKTLVEEVRRKKVRGYQETGQVCFAKRCQARRLVTTTHQ